MAISTFIAIAVFLCKQNQLLHPFYETISNPSSCRSSDSRLRHLLEVPAPAFCLLGFPMTGFRQRMTGSAHTAAVPSRIRTWFPCPFILLLPQYDHNEFLIYLLLSLHHLPLSVNAIQSSRNTCPSGLHPPRLPPDASASPSGSSSFPLKIFR